MNFRRDCFKQTAPTCQHFNKNVNLPSAMLFYVFHLFKSVRANLLHVSRRYGRFTLSLKRPRNCPTVAILNICWTALQNACACVCIFLPVTGKNNSLCLRSRMSENCPHAIKKHTRGWGKAKNICLGLYCTRSWKYFVSQLMFVSATSPKVLCMSNFVYKSFLFINIFLSCQPGQGPWSYFESRGAE